MANYRTVTCNSCEVLVINNVICHELGCPDKWRDEVRHCKECGTKFKPDSIGQVCCSEECAGIYYGVLKED
jgi:hypothetical protein